MSRQQAAASREASLGLIGVMDASQQSAALSLAPATAQEEVKEESKKEDLLLDLEYYDDDDEQAKDWHFVAFFRLSELDQNLRVSMDEILTALAALAEDMKLREEWQSVPEMKRARLRRLNRNRWTKLERAWEFADRDNDRIMSRSELAAMFGRMMKVGFFSAGELLYQSQLFPPKYDIMKPQMIADKYFEELGKNKDTDGISWQEFRGVTESCRLADAKEHPKFWFLVDKRTGFFKGIKIKFTERLQRWRHKNGQAINPLLQPDPATAGYSPRAFAKRGASANHGNPRQTVDEEDDDDEYEDDDE